MRVLAFDVSVTGCSVCVMDTETGRSYTERIETERGQAESLIPMIERLCQQAAVSIQDISCIAVTRGPGSFTGVRIGLATARSLGLALDCPVMGFSTLDVIARGHEVEGNVLFLIDTKRGDYYGQIGENAVPRIWSEEEVSAFEGEVVKDRIPDIEILARMAQEIYGREFSENYSPTPLYLREAEVSQPKNIPRCVVDLSD